MASSDLVIYVRDKLRVIQNIRSVILQSDGSATTSLEGMHKRLKQFNMIKKIICRCSKEDKDGD